MSSPKADLLEAPKDAKRRDTVRGPAHRAVSSLTSLLTALGVKEPDWTPEHTNRLHLMLCKKGDAAVEVSNGLNLASEAALKNVKDITVTKTEPKAKETDGPTLRTQAHHSVQALSLLMDTLHVSHSVWTTDHQTKMQAILCQPAYEQVVRDLAHACMVAYAAIENRRRS